MRRDNSAQSLRHVWMHTGRSSLGTAPDCDARKPAVRQAGRVRWRVRERIPPDRERMRRTARFVRAVALALAAGEWEAKASNEKELQSAQEAHPREGAEGLPGRVPGGGPTPLLRP